MTPAERLKFLREEISALDKHMFKMKERRTRLARERDDMVKAEANTVGIRNSSNDEFYVSITDVACLLAEHFDAFHETKINLARRAEVNVRTIRRILNGGYDGEKYITLRVADKLCTAMGHYGLATTLQWYKRVYHNGKIDTVPLEAWRERQEQLEQLAGY